MSAGKIIISVGAVGAAAGIGYMIWRHLERRREAEQREPAEEREPAKAKEDEEAERQQDEARKAENRRKFEERWRAEEQRKAEERRRADERQRVERAWQEAEANRPNPGPGPQAEPKAPSGQVGSIRLNQSHVDDEGTVTESPEELLDQARKFDPTITLDELTAARLAASEHHGGNFAELTCIIDSELNRAERKGKSLFESLTYERTFGKQGKRRRASTRQDPKMRHLWAARAVLSGAARGISRGSERFFDPKAMDVMHTKYREWVDGGRKGKKPAIVSCDALDILEAWSFDYGRQGANRCPPDRTKRGRNPLAWVGPIQGVDPLRLMLMKPADPDDDHAESYRAARELLIAGLRRKPDNA